MAGAWILVADDNAGIRETTVEILKDRGFQVVVAEDGEEALSLLKSGSFDAAILDVRMPRRDGLSVVDQMIPDPPPPGVIVASAYDIEPEIRARLGTKVFKYLRKPVRPLALLEAVHGACRVGLP